MSLITRCPACETMFKVVPDQLRISEGWVRCGHCSEIFNASQHLVSYDAPRAMAPTGASAPIPTAPGPVITGAAPIAWQRSADPESFRQQAAAPAAPADAAQPFASTADVAVVGEVAPPAPAFALPSGYLDGRQTTKHPESWPQETGPPPDADVSFMRVGTNNAFWRRRPARMVLIALAIALAAALAVQGLLHERNRLAQLEPATRPFLAGLCELARCELGPLRQIESIVIDSSSFGRVRADNYRLGFSLRNTAPVDVAMPAIELSLTDTQDQALVRRVILPAEFGAASLSLAAGSDWSGTLALQVRAATSTDRITGYRLLAFYP